MPHKCAVATCRGNYKNGPKVAVFKFPNETELRMKWIRSLRRKDGFQPTKHTRVCELHFRSDEIIREIEMYDEKSAKLIKAPISRPRLKKGCIPSQFPDGPSYMSSNSVSRMSPEKKKARLEEKYLEKAIEESLKMKERYDNERSFESLIEFNNCLEHQILETFWTTVHTENSTMLLDILSDPAPEIQKS
ncbi:THAP domain-containing protein 2-like [Stegodyphus dumicola]|uniref:THAP domain-containing protein 2-like n=1 Tax=Stegodyphus dumicola TaxID=202533 RepID=UPI0015B01E06|nr:THAP domain-containing protein 2-like [Stegodyphus dumicola]